MSTPATEAGMALPVTGSGPFTFILGVIGLALVGVGALSKRVARIGA